MKTLKTLDQFLNESTSAVDMNQFAQEVADQGDPSDIWNDVENGKKYIVIETEGMNRHAERQLRAITKGLASVHGYQVIDKYHTAEKLGIGNAYADDAILVYVGK
jgi:hypothetical protein